MWLIIQCSFDDSGHKALLGADCRCETSLVCPHDSDSNMSPSSEAQCCRKHYINPEPCPRLVRGLGTWAWFFLIDPSDFSDYSCHMTPSTDSPLTRWQRDRRAFIEHRIFWHGSIGLADLMEVMGISRAQASKDLNGYITDHPDHLFYDKSARTYVIGDEFQAHYLTLDPAELLGDMVALSRGAAVPKSDWIVGHPDVLVPGVPARGLDPLTVRAVLMACHQKRKLLLTYQSMSQPAPVHREIAPHGLAHDGFRWHARAYCFRTDTFKDFVLGRMADVHLGDATDVDPLQDRDWSETVTLLIGPHPQLSDSQRRAIELDYAMTGGVAEIHVPKCLLFYNLKRLGLDADSPTRRPEDQHIVLLNADDVLPLLGRNTK